MGVVENILLVKSKENFNSCVSTKLDSVQVEQGDDNNEGHSDSKTILSVVLAVQKISWPKN